MQVWGLNGKAANLPKTGDMLVAVADNDLIVRVESKKVHCVQVGSFVCCRRVGAGEATDVIRTR